MQCLRLLQENGSCAVVPTVKIALTWSITTEAADRTLLVTQLAYLLSSLVLHVRCTDCDRVWPTVLMPGVTIICFQQAYRQEILHHNGVLKRLCWVKVLSGLLGFLSGDEAVDAVSTYLSTFGTAGKQLSWRSICHSTWRLTCPHTTHAHIHTPTHSTCNDKSTAYLFPGRSCNSVCGSGCTPMAILVLPELQLLIRLRDPTYRVCRCGAAVRTAASSVREVVHQVSRGNILERSCRTDSLCLQIVSLPTPASARSVTSAANETVLQASRQQAI